jgi:hypothetical protein
MQRSGIKARLFGVLVAVACLFSAPLGAAEGEGRRAPVSLDEKAEWALRLPADENVVYQGVVSLDQAGVEGNAFLYPAPNAVGLLAAIVTHSVLVGAAKKSQKSKLQEEADKILLPYRGVLDSFSYRDLMQKVLPRISAVAAGKLVEPTVNQGREMVVESAPVFSMTQDQRAIVVDNAIAILLPGVVPEEGYHNSIRVVSGAKDEKDPLLFWGAKNGERIKDESARLLAESLDIAFADYAAEAKRDELPYRTIRYKEGAVERMERAQVISQRCDRLLIRTLRGALMSVPVSRTTTPAGVSERCG